MNRFLKNYLTFNKRELRGIIALSSIIIILLVILITLKKFPAAEQFDFTEFEKELENKTVTRPFNTAKSSLATKSVEENNVVVTKFYFDPNDLSEKEWMILGLKEKQVTTIKKYINKGGKFYKKEDLKKIYGISENQYKELEPYILFSNKKKLVEEIKDPTQKLTTTYLEINSADSSMLVGLKGIGPAFANRIIKYRNLLGGFFSDRQLFEIYGITREIYQIIQPQIIVDSSKIVKLNINTVDLKKLSKHPYVKYKTALLIINYREKHGRYKNINDLSKIEALSDSTLLKIFPYITTN